MDVPLHRFTDTARAVAALSMSDATRLVHPEIGTEHILAAIVGHADNEGARLLRSLGVTKAKTLAALLSVDVPPKPIPKPPLPLAELAKKMMVLAVAEADACKADRVGPEHFLLAMTQMPECAGYKMLEVMGTSGVQVRIQMRGWLGL